MWKRTIAPVVVVSLFWLIVGGATSYYLTWQSRVLDHALEENVSSIRAAGVMQVTAGRMQDAALLSSIHQSPASNESQVELERRFVIAFKAAEAAAATPREASLMESIRNRFEAYSQAWRRNMSSPGSIQTTLDELTPLVHPLSETCEEVIRYNEDLLRDASQRRQNLTYWIVWGRAGMLIVGPGMGLLMGFRLAKQLRTSITRISVGLQTVAGDLKQELGQLQITPHDDLPALQGQLDIIADRMRAVVQELHQARRETMRVEQLAAVGELAAGVAHELRNPLTSVKLLIQTMQHRQPQQISNESFDVVLEEIRRMETTIQGLLDFARPPTLNRAVHDVRQIVQRAVNLTEGKAHQSGVRIVTHFDLLPALVNCDAEQLHQVCINLLLNGIESMTVGGDFEISVVTDQSAALVRIVFEDAGEGIPPNILPRLFEPFVTSKEHGTGLGLAVSRRMILNNCGRLLAANRPIQGAVLTIELPHHAPHDLRMEAHAHNAAG
ncbi:MAG: hypothetical protein JSS49_26705 [Planctomycetes bacterium]|nr:hypothetical protein [Planctomycetota bacterium]